MAKYTFLIPSYKATYLKFAIESIQSQTYDDFDVIISDDCSPDNLKAIVAYFSASSFGSKIRYERNERNFGGEHLVDHWNKLVNKCRSEYLIMASDDDIYDSHFLEEINKLATKYPQADVIRARVQRINNRGDVIAKEDIFDEFQSESEAIRGLLCGNTIGCIGNYVFKTQKLREIGGFVSFPYAWFSDMATVIAMNKNGQANTLNTLFSFRLSGENISTLDKHKETEIGKLKATVSFDQWMSKRIDGIKHDDSVWHQNLFNEILSSYKHRIYGQAGDYSWALPWWKWKGLYKSFQNNRYFSKGRFLKYFGIAVFNRWFNKLQIPRLCTWI